MIEKIADIMVLTKETKTSEELEKLIKEHLGIDFSQCAEALSSTLRERAQELLEDLPNMAPLGDYDKLTEDPEAILKFLQEEAVKPEHWQIQFVEVRKPTDQLMEMCFFNKAVDDGDSLKGFVFVGLSGKIRHCFCQVNS
jgi:hypothetical protein